MAEAKPDTDFLAGGGEMGERIRGFDWLPTPLGSIKGWPQIMRLTVGLCVKSRFPIIIHWGWPDLTVLYNDAFIPFAGEKHPGLLGRPLFESWPELQPTLGPMLESVLTNGKAAFSDDLLLVYNRSGYLEETYYTLSFNPIVLESGNVGGSFSLIDYTTDRVIGERRLRTLRDLAARTGEAKQIEECYRIAAEVLASNSQDVPFALLYLVNENRKQARLIATAGLKEGGAVSPKIVDLTAQEQNLSEWPLARVAGGTLAERVDNLKEKFGPLPGGAWPVPPQTGLVLPIIPPGNELPSGLLVAAVNPRKALDAAYEGFFHAVARQIAASLVGVLAYQSLVELDRAKTAFFSNVSHEFRTPLTLLIGPLEGLLASEGSSMSAQNRDTLELAVRNGLRLQKLVNSLLDFSRIEAHRMQAAYQATDLAALTASLASVFRSAIEKAGIRLVVDCPRLAELVYVDHEMWEKIVLNLLSNAFKYTFEGEIRIGLRQVDDAVNLSVSDTGVGIPNNELPRVFERFYRVESIRGRTVEGTGIGLALVQELVKLHGGTIWAESSIGRGSVFTVSIPTGKEHLPIENLSDRNLTAMLTSGRAFVEEALRWLPEASTRTNAVGSPASGLESVHQFSGPDTVEVSGRKARILLADDNADMRNYVRRLLSDRYEITTVADGETALAALRQNQPDLVLTDVMMPRLDGFGLLKAIRSDPATSTIPVILLSARAGDESKVEGLGHGADDYLAKPFSARELSARVAAHVALARLRKEASEREAQEKRAADLQLIVDTVPGLVWTMTAAGDVELVNRQMLEYFGKTLEELKGWTTSDAVHPDDLPHTIAAWNVSVKTAAPYDVDHRLRRADGAHKWFHSRGIPLQDSEGRIARWYNLLTDIDERKQAEEKLRR
ncbi:MAG TPA: ATP-binding protein, partial [Terriglobales bacterium]